MTADPAATPATPSTPSTSRTALITGASRGLGRALAERLAADGWRLVIDARDGDALQAVADKLAGMTSVTAIPGDVADEGHRAALAAAVRELGRLDALVLNASTLGPTPLPELAEYPIEALEQVYRVNVLAPLRITQLLLPLLEPDARVVAVTSDAGVEHYPGWGGYGSSKAALEQVFAVLAEERPDLRVYRVDPGDLRTQMQQDAFPGEDISDRPLPEVSVPGLVQLLDGSLASGRYIAQELSSAGEAR